MTSDHKTNLLYGAIWNLHQWLLARLFAQRRGDKIAESNAEIRIANWRMVCERIHDVEPFDVPGLKPRVGVVVALLLLFFTLHLPSTNAATVTAYCPCAKCCGQVGNLTKAGTVPKQGITIAAPRSVPLGTVVYVHGIGPRIVEDRKARRFNNSWDIFFNSHAEARAFGKQQLRVEIIRESRRVGDRRSGRK